MIGYTRTIRKKDKYLNNLYLSNNLKKSVGNLDYLIIACPLTKSTKIINSTVFKYMKKNVVIINIARGAIINEKDLYDALKRLIGGVIIDTWFKYPQNKEQNGFKPSKYSFNKIKNVIMTPHISAWSENMIQRRSRVISENINRLYNKKGLINLVKSLNNPSAFLCNFLQRLTDSAFSLFFRRFFICSSFLHLSIHTFSLHLFFNVLRESTLLSLTITSKIFSVLKAI